MIHKRQIVQFFVLGCVFPSLFWGCGGDEKTTPVRFVEAVEDFTQVSASDLDFGRRENTYVITLTNNNYDSARWTASADVSWITVEPERGRMPPSAEISIQISVNRGELTSAEGRGLVTIDIPAYRETKQVWVKVLN